VSSELDESTGISLLRCELALSGSKEKFFVEIFFSSGERVYQFEIPQFSKMPEQQRIQAFCYMP